MGSLMSGWSSSVLSDKEVRLLRNRSLTKEEVEAFWRQHGGTPAENGEVVAAAGSPLAGSPRAGIPLAARQLKVMRSMPPLRGMRSDEDLSSPSLRGCQLQAQHSLPRIEPSSPATTRVERFFFFPENAADTSSTSRGWWTRSSWAFLNEPPKDKEEVLHAASIVTGNA